MRKAKLFLIGTLFLVGFLWLIALFLPSKITVSRWTLINANEKNVAMEINSFKNWKNWYPAFQNNDISVNISQSSSTPFATLTNKKTGENLSLELLASSEDSIQFNVSGVNENRKTYEFILAPNSKGQTQVTWNINVELGRYSWNKFSGIFLDKIVGPQCEAALENLKKAAEKNVR